MTSWISPMNATIASSLDSLRSFYTLNYFASFSEISSLIFFNGNFEFKIEGIQKCSHTFSQSSLKGATTQLSYSNLLPQHLNCAPELEFLNANGIIGSGTETLQTETHTCERNQCEHGAVELQLPRYICFRNIIHTAGCRRNYSSYTDWA